MEVICITQRLLLFLVSSDEVSTPSQPYIPDGLPELIWSRLKVLFPGLIRLLPKFASMDLTEPCPFFSALISYLQNPTFPAKCTLDTIMVKHGFRYGLSMISTELYSWGYTIIIHVSTEVPSRQQCLCGDACSTPPKICKKARCSELVSTSNHYR